VSVVVLRPARLADAERIFNLIQEHKDDLVPRSMGNIVENADRFIVAEAGGELVGCISWHIYPEMGEPGRAAVELQSVAVRASQRRQGVGRSLVKAALERIAAFRPAEAVVLTFAPEFFSALGFREIPKTQVMYKLYAGCVNCTKHADPFTCPEKAMMLTLPAGAGR